MNFVHRTRVQLPTELEILMALLKVPLDTISTRRTEYDDAGLVQPIQNHLVYQLKIIMRFYHSTSVLFTFYGWFICFKKGVTINLSTRWFRNIEIWTVSWFLSGSAYKGGKIRDFSCEEVRSLWTHNPSKIGLQRLTNACDFSKSQNLPFFLHIQFRLCKKMNFVHQTGVQLPKDLEILMSLLKVPLDTISTRRTEYDDAGLVQPIQNHLVYPLKIIMRFNHATSVLFTFYGWFI